MIIIMSTIEFNFAYTKFHCISQFKIFMHTINHDGLKKDCVVVCPDFVPLVVSYLI